MRSPLEDGVWHYFDEIGSTQDLAAAEVLTGKGGVFFARKQTAGRGRFGREWITTPDQSLAMSLAFPSYANHNRPFLIGMTVAIAAAAALHCELAWPNDLVAEGRKLGGILTEMMPGPRGARVPVVGVGINLNQRSFPPEISARAISAAIYNGGAYDPLEVAESIVGRLIALPEPHAWADIAPVWKLFDHTPGKRYVTNEGREAIALGIGPEGQLMCSVEGETVSIMAGDAMFGHA